MLFVNMFVKCEMFERFVLTCVLLIKKNMTDCLLSFIHTVHTFTLFVITTPFIKHTL